MGVQCPCQELIRNVTLARVLMKTKMEIGEPGIVVVVHESCNGWSFGFA